MTRGDLPHEGAGFPAKKLKIGTPLILAPLQMNENTLNIH